MKTFPFLCAMVLLLTTGCSRNYVVTLNNGMQLGAKGKPRLENGMYYYTDARGGENAVAASRVKEIAPASQMPRKEKSKTSR